MKKLILPVLLLFPILLSAQQSNRIRAYPLKEFRSGLNIKTSTIKLLDSETPDCRDVLFDENNTISSRLGYSSWASNLPVSGSTYLISEYKRQSGESWIMINISTSVYASKDDGVTWIKVKEGLSEVSGGQAVVYDDEWVFTNGVDDVFSWNGDTTTTFGFIPQGKYIEVHNNQLFVANVPENYSALFWCNSVKSWKRIEGWEYYNSFIVGENEGDTITALKSEGSVLVIWKDNSVWFQAGDGLRYDIPVKYTDVYGCISQNSINLHKESPLALSKRGLVRLGRGNVQQVDRNVEDLTTNATISVGTIVGKSWIQTTESDFNLGTTSNVLVTDGVIRVLPDETYYEDSRSVHGERFHTGYNNVWEYRPVEEDDIQIQQEYRSSFGGDALTQYEVVAPFSNIIVPPAPYTAQYSLQNLKLNLKRTSSDVFESSVTVRIQDIEGTVLGEHTRWITDLGNGDWYTFFSTYTVSVRRTSRIKVLRRQSAAGGRDSGFDILLYFTPKLLWERAQELTTSNADYNTRAAKWKNEGWEITKVMLGPIINGGQQRYVTLRRQVASSNHAWYAMEYEYSISPSSSGFYTSQKFDAGANINTWKHFLPADYGDNITYNIRYATGSAALDDASWVSIESGGLIQATTSQRWIQWRAYLGDQRQKVDNVLLRWFETNGSDYQDVSSEFFKNRYHMAFSTFGYTNNRMLLYDYNERFSLWNINAESLGVYKNQLLFASGGVLYKLYDTRNDNSSAINAYWESKDLDFGSPDIDKHIEKIGITTSGSGTLTLSWKSNYDTTWSTAAITLGSLDNEVINVPSHSPAKYWRFRVETNAVGEWFEVHEIRIYYKFSPLRVRD